jgi:hypothetical protein
MGIGFYHAAWQAEQRLAVTLPDQWQGRDINVIGVVAELPRKFEHGQHFSFDVEKVLTPQASVPGHLYLSTYYSRHTKPPELHAGERWQLTLRLKQPHGSSNPHGFDFELWALENNVRAVGYVKKKAPLDGLILTHDDTDHTGSAASVMQAMPIGWLSSSLPEGHPLLQKTSADMQHCEDGQSWQWDGVQFEILHPDAASYAIPGISDNNRGCVLRISIGKQHILLTADIEKASESELLRQHPDKLPAVLLVVPHHGSVTSSTNEFVAAVRPEYAVFTAGYRNRFGHPKQKVVKRYAESGAQLLRSDEDGAILIGMNARDLQVERYRKTHRHYWTHFTSH